MRTLGLRGMLLMVTALLAGCAATSGTVSLPAGHSKNPFAPVTLFVNANEHVGASHAQLLEHLARQIEASGAFLRVDRGVQRWPSTLQLRHRWEYVPEPSNTVARAGVWLTLGLIPMKVRKQHRLDVDVILEPEPIASLYYEEESTAWVSLFTLGAAAAADRAAVDRMLGRMLAELAAKKLVPRARDVTEPPPLPKKPRKQPA